MSHKYTLFSHIQIKGSQTVVRKTSVVRELHLGGPLNNRDYENSWNKLYKSMQTSNREVPRHFRNKLITAFSVTVVRAATLCYLMHVIPEERQAVVSQKSWYTTASSQGVTTHKTLLDIFTTVLSTKRSAGPNSSFLPATQSIMLLSGRKVKTFSNFKVVYAGKMF